MMKMPDGYLLLAIPEPLSSLIHSCETYCVAGCCEVDAFNMTAEQMAMWIRTSGQNVAHQALGQIDQLIAQTGCHEGKIWSEDFNTIWSPPEFAACLQVWRGEIVRAIALAEGEAVSG